ncbi:baseplate J/gp47 family protein [Fulvivirgaceae bacterium PWU4]|uniref:Baseplate J/gp47 family protein n=1 Tax=Chryseosolibacter histidini TaxID=2782349 RepID=A0AAP2DKW4_9BACT|nr:baseplate J/gp47 family protein [Chryseosolibacter histidini]MBT1698253.1 baseplate J/gp47 family protein [Chryseosolibacter histidini]
MITIPTVKQLYEDIIADLESEYGESIPSFGKVFLRGLAAVQAMKLKLYYLSHANLQKNIFVDTADPESAGGTLERFGRIKLGRNPFPARAGQYEIQVTGTPGSVINALTTFKSDDTSNSPGKLYILDSPFTLVTNPDTCNVRALEAGLDSQLDIGDTLTATAPIAGVNRSAEVVSEVVEPFSAETTEDYRQASIDAYQLEPQGGAPSDFRLWAKDAQGVKQAYPYAKPGVTAEINLYIEATTADSTDGKGTPSAGLLADVKEVVEFDPDTTKSLDERGRRPIGIFQVHYLPITPLNVDINVSGFVGITPSILAQIENALELAISNIRPFIAGADITENKNDILAINKVISIILEARPGSVFGTVALNVGGSPASTYLFTDGEIPFLNSVTIP